eukprot:m.236435 g.236435  ORF g.236435 m.236435 type:complete len:779 (+) comp26183_c1_seq12:696-3032(+)
MFVIEMGPDALIMVTAVVASSCILILESPTVATSTTSPTAGATAPRSSDSDSLFGRLGPALCGDDGRAEIAGVTNLIGAIILATLIVRRTVTWLLHRLHVGPRELELPPKPQTKNTSCEASSQNPGTVEKDEARPCSTEDTSAAETPGPGRRPQPPHRSRPRPGPLTTMAVARTPSLDATPCTPPSGSVAPFAGCGPRYTAAVVILGFLRTTSPPYDMGSTKEEKRDAHYRCVGMTECLELRVKKGAAQYIKLQKFGKKVVVIVSGGDPQQLGSTEAELMSAELVARGVDPSDIVQEDKARHTIENGVFVCSNIIEGQMPTVTSIYVVTNDFHGERSWQIFKHFCPPGASVHRCFAPDGDHDLLLSQTGRKFKASPVGVVDDACANPPTWTSEEVRQLSDHNVGAILHKNIRAYSKLIVAIKNGNLWAVQHAPVTTECKQMRGGAGPFHYACLFAVDSTVVSELLRRSELRPLAAALSSTRCTALHFLPFSAAFEGGVNVDALTIRQLLLDAGCRTNVSGTSSLWAGSRTAEQLWTQEMESNADGRPLTPSRQARRQSFVAFSINRDFVTLREAARVGDLEAVRSWIRDHPDTPLEPTPPYNGSSPLHYACGPTGTNKVAIVTALLCAGADVNHLNSYLASPLHFAVWHQHEEVVRVLLRHGCRTLTQRGDGTRWDVPQTPIELAFRQAAAATSGTLQASVARNILRHLTSAQYTKRVSQQTPLLTASTAEAFVPFRAVSAPASAVRQRSVRSTLPSNTSERPASVSDALSHSAAGPS